jgi:hypothetical protein
MSKFLEAARGYLSGPEKIMEKYFLSVASTSVSS